MSDISSGASREINNVLIKHKLIPYSLGSKQISTRYDVRNLFAEHCESFFEIYPEDFGADQEAGEEYVELLKFFSRKSNNAMIFDELSSQTSNDQVAISFSLNNKEYRWEFEQTTDTISEEFLDYFDLLQEDLSDGRFISFDGGDVPEFAFVPVEVYEVLKKNNVICSVESYAEDEDDSN